MAKGPRMFDEALYEQLGIDFKTGLPCVGRYQAPALKRDLKKLLRLMDEQDAVNRYKIYNLPLDIDNQDLERLIYYRPNLCMFYYAKLDKFFVLPFAFEGGLNWYGMMTKCHPIPIASTANAENTTEYKASADLLKGLSLKILYEIPTDEESQDEILANAENYCVLLKDYTPQLSQTIIPRANLQDPVLDVMSDMIPFMRTSLMNSTGINAMRVQSQDEASEVSDFNNKMYDAALSGQSKIAVVGGLDFQDLANGATQNGADFMQAMQSLDNFRLSAYGLDNGGIFEKKAHMLQSEQEMNQGETNLVLQDGLKQRQHFCDLANWLWGTDMYCEVSESAAGGDLNGDGAIIDDSTEEIEMNEGEENGDE